MRRSTVCFAIVVTLAAAGCGTSESGSPTSTSSASTTAASSTTVPPTSTVLGGASTTSALPLPAVVANPFTGDGAYCTSSTPAAGLKPTSNGVTADTITVVHVRAQLEKLEPIGFAVPLGDTDDVIRTFARIINDCGGIHGRKIDMQTVEFNPLDTSQEQVCVKATEDIKAFAIVSGTGWQGPTARCAAVDKKTVVISSTAAPRETMTEAAGRFIAMDILQEDALKTMADWVFAKKLLDGKKVGVVASSFNGLDKTVRTGLVDYLKSKNVNVTYEVIDCPSTLCNQGHQAAIENLKGAGVDVVFPTMNLVTLPFFMKEAATQGFKPTFYQSNFNSMGGTLTNSQVANFGGDEAAAVYSGTLVIDHTPTGRERVPGAKPTAFNQMCNDAYVKNSAKAPPQLDFIADNTKFGFVATICANLRVLARAAFDAGPELTPDNWASAAGKLGKVDTNAGWPGTITSTKRHAPTEVYVNQILVPCPDPAYKLCVGPTTEPNFPIS